MAKCDEFFSCTKLFFAAHVLCSFKLFKSKSTGQVRLISAWALFGRLFKVKKNGVFVVGISFFVLEIFTFSYYANEGSDDVIDRSTKTVQHSIKNISRNIKAVFFKLGTRNAYYKRNKMKPVVILSWQKLCRWFCFN